MPERKKTKRESLTEQLAGLLTRSVSDKDRSRATLHLLDWLACAVAGAASPAGNIVTQYGQDHQRGPCTAIGVGRLAAESAAFINGALGNMQEMDDIHGPGIVHPGPVVIPAAMACAELLGSSETEFLEAIVRGYEAVVRIASAVGPGHYRRFQNNSTCGPFGAAAAAGFLFGLNEAQMVHALGNAGTLASGLWQMQLEGAMSKHFHTARAAQTGVTCAHLASKGFTGPARMLEGEKGFFATLCPDPSPKAVTADPAAPWKIYEVGFKPWPVCGSLRAPIGAALALKHEFRPEDIAAVKVRTYPEALRFCDNPNPANTRESRFSIQHVVAVAIVEGPPTLESFEPSAINRPHISWVRNLVEIEISERLSSRYPHHRGAEVEVRVRGGDRIVGAVDDAPGDPDNPLDDFAIEGKARMSLAAGGLGEDVAQAIISNATALANGGSLNDLTALLYQTAITGALGATPGTRAAAPTPRSCGTRAGPTVHK